MLVTLCLVVASIGTHYMSKEFDNMSGQQESGSNQESVRKPEEPVRLEKATFGAGCFWGVEAAFRRIEGVTATAVGYTGGHLAKPTYRAVCSDRTGHAEAVQVTYDPSKVSYEQLLEVFWRIHDPTTLNRQGPDIGSQYRSAIFYHNERQLATAKAWKEKLEMSGGFNRPIVTEIRPASKFYRAEEYHQRYLEKKGRTSCSSTVR